MIGVKKIGGNSGGGGGGGAYIPLLGTTEGNPVAGNIEVTSNTKIHTKDSYENQQTSKIELTTSVVHINVSDTVSEKSTNFFVGDNGVFLDSDDSSKGILANKLFSKQNAPFAFAQMADLKTDFTTQVITTGGNYNNLEVTADLLVFKNENAQAILNGVWGKKEFHILNLSTAYEVKINHNSGSVLGNGQPIMLPTASGNMGIKGSARILNTEGYGYFVADTWGSKYRPEFAGNTEPKVVIVDGDCNAQLEGMTEFIVYLDAQAMPMSKAQLNTRFPTAERPFQVVCNLLGLIYMKNNNNTNDWHSIAMTAIA